MRPFGAATTTRWFSVVAMVGAFVGILSMATVCTAFTAPVVPRTAIGVRPTISQSVSPLTPTTTTVSLLLLPLRMVNDDTDSSNISANGQDTGDSIDKKEERQPEPKTSGLALIPLFFKLCAVLTIKFLTDLMRPFKYVARKSKAQWSRFFSSSDSTGAAS